MHARFIRRKKKLYQFIFCLPEHASLPRSKINKKEIGLDSKTSTGSNCWVFCSFDKRLLAGKPPIAGVRYIRASLLKNVDQKISDCRPPSNYMMSLKGEPREMCAEPDASWENIKGNRKSRGNVYRPEKVFAASAVYADCKIKNVWVNPLRRAES